MSGLSESGLHRGPGSTISERFESNFEGSRDVPVSRTKQQQEDRHWSQGRLWQGKIKMSTWTNGNSLGLRCGRRTAMNDIATVKEHRRIGDLK